MKKSNLEASEMTKIIYISLTNYFYYSPTQCSPNYAKLFLCSEEMVKIKFFFWLKGQEQLLHYG